MAGRTRLAFFLGVLVLLPGPGAADVWSGLSAVAICHQNGDVESSPGTSTNGPMQKVCRKYSEATSKRATVRDYLEKQCLYSKVMIVGEAAPCFRPYQQPDETGSSFETRLALLSRYEKAKAETDALADEIIQLNTEQDRAEIQQFLKATE